MAGINHQQLSSRTQKPQLKPVSNPRVTLVRWTKKVVRGLLLLGFSTVFLFPIYWMIMTSLKDSSDVLIVPPLMVPSSATLEGFLEAPKQFEFAVFFGNTLYLAILNVFGTLASCSLAAYGFSRIKWPGRDYLFVVTLLTMMIPIPVLMIPLYSIFLKAGLIGTMIPLWIPSFFGTAYFIFLLRQFFMTIPKNLSEAARIDGCNEFRIFLQIILPLAQPALMVVGLFSFLYVWNDLIGPLIYLTDSANYTLTIGIQDYADQPGGAPQNVLMAAGVMITFPVFLLYFITQKTFLEGIALTGIKH